MTDKTAAPDPALRPSPPSRLLRAFGAIEVDEAVTAALLTANVFLLLTAHYVLKTAREPLILLHGGAEVKAYASAGQALLLFALVPAYGALARRMGGTKLIAGVYGFFVVNLILFALWASRGVDGGSGLGVAFYLWVGVFNVTVIAQFWSFASDIYTPEQGKRVFAVLGIGSSAGAIVGALFARRLAELGPRAMMLSAAAVLCVCTLLFVLAHHRERGRRGGRGGGVAVRDRPAAGGPALALLARDRFVLLIAVLTLVINFVNTNGEYVLDRALLASVSPGARADQAAFVAEFKAEYFGWINVAGALLQALAVSRLLRRFGVRRTLFVLPIVAFASYGAMLVAPVLAVILVGKLVENSLFYSVENTARQALFLIGDRHEKYVGRTAVDTMIVRLGDVLSAAVVGLGSALRAPITAFAAFNLALIAGWLLVLMALVREHRRRSAALAAGDCAERAV